MMFLWAFLVIIGFMLLIKGADFLVEGASSIARKFHIPDLIIGLTIVAFGTSAPELVVCIIAAIQGNGGIVAGNVIGSNIANLCLILGTAGIMAPLSLQKSTLWRDIPFLLLSTFALLFIILANNSPHLVLRMEALVLLAMMAVYMFFMFRTAGKGIEDELENIDEVHSLVKSTLFILGGLAGLVGGGQLIVANSIKIASTLGVSEELIGLSVVALGTSLPELATAIVAVRKNKADIAIGNVIGSDIFNTTLVLGITGTIRPVNTAKLLNNDMFILTAATILLAVFMFTGRKSRIDRWEASILMAIYILYMGYVLVRG